MDKAELLVHMMQGSATGLSWLYLWQDKDGTHRSKKRPGGTNPLEMTINMEVVKVTGHLTQTNRLSESTRKRMEDMEII